MLTTVAWTLADGTTHYALEGSIFVTGAAIQWLRDGLELFDDAAEAGPLAAIGRRLGRRVRRAGLHRPRFAVVGPLRPGHDRRHHPRRGTGPSHARCRGVDGIPDARRGRRHGGCERHRHHRPARRRWGLGDGSAVSDPGRPTRGDGSSPCRPRDHRARCCIPRRPRRGRVADDRRDRRSMGGGRRVHPRRRPDRSPTSSTPSGSAPSSAPAPGTS